MRGTQRFARAALCALLLAAACAAPAHALVEPGQTAISPDGQNVYVPDYGRTFALSRDAETGKLALLGIHQGGGSMAELAPDARHLYVANGREIRVFAREAGGALRYVGLWSHSSASFADLEFRDDRTAYVTDPGRNALLILERDPATGRIGLRRDVRNGEEVPEGLVGAGAIALAGSFLHVVEGYEDVSSFRLADNGDPTLDFDGYRRDEPAAGQHAMAMGSQVFELDPASGRLSGLPQRVSSSGGNASVGDGTVLVVGSAVFGVEWSEHRLVQYDRGPGGLTLRRAYYEGRDGQGISYPRSLALSPDGRHVYLAAGPPMNATHHAGVTTFTRDPATGELRFASTIGGFDLEPGNTERPQTEPAVLRINEGDEFTNDREVILSLGRIPGHIHAIEVSNDGGFKKSERITVDETNAYPWTLTSTGPERLAKTVYVRLIGPNPYGYGQIADEIVLDERAPTVVSARRAKNRVAVRARDTLSGVSHIQTTRNPKKPGKWRRFAKSVAVPKGRGTIRVRVRDRAQNQSKWRVVKR